MKFVNPKRILPRTAVVFACLVLSMSMTGLPEASALDFQPPPSFAPLAKEVKHPVVNISTLRVTKTSPLQQFGGPDSGLNEFFKKFFGNIPEQERETAALGSGFIISKDGLILTNNHVIQKAEKIRVKIDIGKEYDAEVVGKDPDTDLALIKVKPDSDFPEPAQLGNSDAIEVGDWVMAVGNPFGLGQTVTQGIISAKGRVIGAGPYDDFLQTDAAINPGNSGGPLFNMSGEVIGINTAIVAQGQNIGFAIPINVAKNLLPQLKKGKVVRGWLGIGIQNITPELAKVFNLSSTKGVLVSSVMPNSPADKAGLKQGDVILKFEGEEISDAGQLSRMVATRKPGSQVKLEIMRDGNTRTIEVTLGTKPSGQEEQPAPQKTELGLSVQNLTPEMARQFGFPGNASGVVVSQVQPGSPADTAGLRPGDLIREVNRQKVEDTSEYEKAIQESAGKKSVLMLVQRGEATFYVVLQRK